MIENRNPDRNFTQNIIDLKRFDIDIKLIFVNVKKTFSILILFGNKTKLIGNLQLIAYVYKLKVEFKYSTLLQIFKFSTIIVEKLNTRIVEKLNN